VAGESPDRGGARVIENHEGVKVEIYDQSYFMRGELDPEYIRKLAEFVDSRMRSIAMRTRNADTMRVAVLAALNIADECHQLRSRVAQVEQKINECSLALDTLLEVG
jgi:cell division protein ZapA